MIGNILFIIVWAVIGIVAYHRDNNDVLCFAVGCVIGHLFGYLWAVAGM